MKRKRNLKKETEELIMATQDQSSPPRWVKHYVDRTSDSRKCRMCEKMDENFSDVVSECIEAQNEYKKLRYDKAVVCCPCSGARHDKAVVLLSLQWCETYGFKTHEKYEHFVEKKMRRENEKRERNIRK